MSSRSLAALSLAFISTGVFAAETPKIPPLAIKAHIDFLASDVLEGRETGTRAYDVAAQYVASQFEAAGLEPASQDGTYFQKIKFRSAMADGAHGSFVLDDRGARRQFSHRKEILFHADLVHPQSDAEGDVVFAGFGIAAPELKHDDYEGIDAHGKIVLILSGAPSRFPNDQRAFYSSSEEKLETAARHGAIGVLVLKTLTDEKRSSFTRAAQQPEMSTMRYLRENGVPADTVEAIRANVAVSAEAAQAMFGHAPVPLTQVLDDAEKSIPHSFPLGVHATIHTVTTFSTAESSNVVARLRGSDPEKSKQHVLLTAHLDHLGIAPTGLDRIYNGALDNASGVAALLEIGRAMAGMPTPPARSVLFAALTGEEKGEQGSQYLAAHPTVPGVVADINMDMFTMIFPVKDIVPLGGEHSTLGDLARQAAVRAGFEVTSDPQPEEVRFIRSDQYSFVRAGVPSMTFKGGTTSADASVNGPGLLREWLRTIYHTVRDGPRQNLDYPSGARWADANLLLVLAVANAPEPPRWKQGDFFGQKFGQRAAE